MSPEEFSSIYPHVIFWIQQTLATHQRNANSVASRGFARLPRYFSEHLLTTSKVVVLNLLPVPPLSKLGLNRFAEFEQENFDGITYLETFFIKPGHEENEGLHFHELIHVLQRKMLGPETFLARYADGLETKGYRNSPLEVMAYNAEAHFRNSTAAFDVEKLVAQQLEV
jgi:hypothetical protein